MLALFMALVLLGSEQAHGADAPWTLPKGGASLYLGASETSWSGFWGPGDPWSPKGQSVGTRVYTSLIGGNTEYGLNARWTVSLGGAGGWSRVRSQQDPACDAFGADACSMTVGLSTMSLRFRYRVLDQSVGAPLTVSAGPVLRLSGYTREHRDRLTALGDGLNDLGLQLAAGRTGWLGSVAVSGHVAGRYARRLILHDLQDAAVPRHELAGVAQVSASPLRRWTFALALDGLHRPGGRDWSGADSVREDRFAALSVSELKTGLKAGVQARDGVSIWMSGLRTVYARNNPADSLSVSVGVAWFERRGTPGGGR